MGWQSVVHRRGDDAGWGAAAEAHGFLPLDDLNFREAGPLQQLDEFLYFSDVH
jgi:hypothetical protein